MGFFSWKKSNFRINSPFELPEELKLGNEEAENPFAYFSQPTKQNTLVDEPKQPKEPKLPRAQRERATKEQAAKEEDQRPKQTKQQSKQMKQQAKA